MIISTDLGSDQHKLMKNMNFKMLQEQFISIYKLKLG